MRGRDSLHGNDQTIDGVAAVGTELRARPFVGDRAQALDQRGGRDGLRATSASHTATKAASGPACIRVKASSLGMRGLHWARTLTRPARPLPAAQPRSILLLLPQ